MLLSIVPLNKPLNVSSSCGVLTGNISWTQHMPLQEASIHFSGLWARPHFTWRPLVRATFECITRVQGPDRKWLTGAKVRQKTFNLTKCWTTVGDFFFTGPWPLFLFYVQTASAFSSPRVDVWRWRHRSTAGLGQQLSARGCRRRKKVAPPPTVPALPAPTAGTGGMGDGQSHSFSQTHTHTHAHNRGNTYSSSCIAGWIYFRATVSRDWSSDTVTVTCTFSGRGSTEVVLVLPSVSLFLLPRPIVPWPSWRFPKVPQAPACQRRSCRRRRRPPATDKIAG